MSARSNQGNLLLCVVAISAFACSAADLDLKATGPGGSNGSGGGGVGSGGTGGFGGTNSGGGGGGSTSQGIPCDVKTVLDARCSATCHTSPPTFGAPMSLTGWQDFQKPAPKDSSRRVYQSVADRIHRTGAGRMPDNGALSASEMSTLDSWIAAGSPMGSTCGGGAPGDAGGGYRDGALPDAPTDEGTECVEFRAHGQQMPGDRTPFDSTVLILQPGEFYACFNFTSPWKNAVQGLQFSTIVDNTQTLHHWLFYQTPLPVTDGSSNLCDGQHPGQALITGWAPGNQDLELPPDVGLELAPPTGNYVLELHYNNPAGMPFQDASGVRVCASSKFRPKTASITWTGTEKISIPARSTGNAGGKCVPGRLGMGPNDPINIFASWPHMHKTGTHMKTVINRVAGGEELLIDKPFNFASQLSYTTPATLYPGDTLFTTCTYDNTTTGSIGFGPSTTQEMCYDFVYAYPAHALDHPLLGPIVTSGATNLCADN